MPYIFCGRTEYAQKKSVILNIFYEQGPFMASFVSM